MTKKLSRIVALMLAVIMSFSMLLVPVEAASFKDVSNKAWYKAAVDYVAERGWMSGVSSTTFAPNMKVTRGMAVTVLAKVAEADLSAYEPAFADTEAGKWYTKAAAWAADKGIVAGVGDGMFAPNRVITRQDLAAILNKFIKKQDYQITLGEPVSFNDMDSVAGYATEAVSFCAAAGLVSGFEDSTFRPQQTATRAQLATMMMKLDQLRQGYAQPMPAQYFDGQAGENMSVSVYAPEGALPEDTNMTTSLVTDESALDNIQGQLTEGNVVAAADITFTKDDAEIEPSAEVEVLISVKGYFNANNLRVYHVKADGTIEPVDSEIFNERTGFRGPSEQTLHFFANDFSVYAIVDGPDPGGDDDYPYRTTYEFYNADGTKFYFNDAAGHAQYTQILKDGEELADVGIPSKGATRNAKFVGWYVWNEDDTYGAKVEIGQPLSVTANGTIRLKAKLQGLINVFLVTAVMQDDQGQNMSRSVVTVKQVEYTVGQEDPITVNVKDDTTEAPTADQAVVGWNRDETAANAGTTEGTNGVITLYADGNAENIGDVTLFPAIKNTYWLYFDENDGGTGGGASYTKPQFVQIGEKPTRPADPHRTGYTFGGWYKDAACTQEFSFDVPLDGTTTVYAKWIGAATTYSIVVWVQRTSDSAMLTSASNLSNDAKTYDFYRAYSVNATTGGTATVPNNHASRNLASEIDEHGHIKLNRVDAGKTVAGNGSTALNVYYDRDVMTIHWRNTQNGSDTDTWYGLYDATFAEAGKTWKTGNWRSPSYTIVMMDSFKDFDNESDTSLILYTNTSNMTRDVYFYKETLTTNEFTQSFHGDTGSPFKIAEKYTGFRAYQYRTSNYGSWTTIPEGTTNLPSVRFDSVLHVRYQRNSYKIEYHNGEKNTEGTVVQIDSVKYEQPLASHANPTVTYPVAADADHFEFIGWFADSSWSTMVTFTELTDQQKQNYTNWYGISTFVTIDKMPSHNFPLYAGYSLKGWDCALDPNGGEFTSTTQAGVFWLYYGETFSSDLKTNIKREGYVFQGWMIANVEGDLNTVTRNGLRFVGSNSNWTATDTPWEFSTGIEGPTYLQAKWFLKTVMHVAYDGKGGSNVPIDSGDYSDHAITVAFNAPIPPDPEKQVFVGWDIAGTETVEKLQPGTTFEVNSQYATDGIVTLQAVYITLGEEEGDVPVTHIDWYANNKTTAEYPKKGEGDEDDTVTEPTHISISGMQINQGIDILPSNTFTNYGYQFLGWAKLHKGEDEKMYDHLGNEVTAGSDHQDYNLTADDLYLKYDPENNKFQVKVNDAWKDTSQVAADEHLPYEDMYAVWDTSYFYVFHSASGKLDAIPLPTEVKNGKAEPGTFDLTKLVPSDKLYGGYYKEYGGAVKDAVKTAAMNYEYAKSRTDWTAATIDSTSYAVLSSVPNANFKEYTGATAKNGKVKWWDKAKAYKTGDEGFYPGNALTPNSGEVYYLKEVPNTYLAQKYRYVYDVFEDNKIINLYSVTVIDDANYSEVGFREGEGNSYADIAEALTPKDSLCMNFTIVQKGYNNDPPIEHKTTPKDLGVVRGYLAVSNYDDEITKDNVFSLVSAWTTLDGVTVSNYGRTYTMVTNAETNVIDEIETSVPEGMENPDNHLYVNIGYKKDGDNVWWYNDNCETILYFFTPSDQENAANLVDEYVKPTKVGETDYWTAEVPEGSEYVMILRVRPGSFQNGSLNWGENNYNVPNRSGVITMKGNYNQAAEPPVNCITKFNDGNTMQPVPNAGVEWGNYTPES